MTLAKNRTGARPISILLVDDDDGDALAVMRAFRKARIANPIVRAVDGQAALELLRAGPEGLPKEPFLLLVDINMPRIGGHELVAEMRKDPFLKKMVVFMLTTSHSKEDIDAAYENNVAGYIAKETAGHDFLSLVGALEAYWNIVEMPSMY